MLSLKLCPKVITLSGFFCICKKFTYCYHSFNVISSFTTVFQFVCFHWICSWLVEALKQVGNNVSRLSQLTENNNNNNDILTFKNVEKNIPFQKQKIVFLILWNSPTFSNLKFTRKDRTQYNHLLRNDKSNLVFKIPNHLTYKCQQYNMKHF